MINSFHRHHVPVSILCPISPDKTPSLIETLENLNNDLHSNINDHLPALFHAVNTHHFCCWTLLPATKGKFDNYPAQLLFESNIDESLHQYIDRLVQHDSSTLISIYEHCEGFDPENIKPYLIQHQHKPSAYYRGAHYHSMEQIRNDHVLYELLAAFIDEKQQSGSLIDYFDAGLKHQLIQHLKHTDIHWPLQAQQRQPDTFWWTLAVFILLLPVLVIPLLIIFGLLYVATSILLAG